MVPAWPCGDTANAGRRELVEWRMKDEKEFGVSIGEPAL